MSPVVGGTKDALGLRWLAESCDKIRVNEEGNDSAAVAGNQGIAAVLR
jgi:hypothetical protein